MKGSSFSEFIDALYLGREIEFKYLTNKYIILWREENKNDVAIEVFNMDDKSTLSSIVGFDYNDAVDKFLESKIFGDKTINDIEALVEVTYIY